MKTLYALFLFTALSCLIPQTMAQEAFNFNIDELNIPHKKFVLDNGLTLIVHEDHKAPIVAVNVWYHVGSKNEKTGKTGFAHLFEHLMFNGSENFNDDYFQAMESVGATDLNGTTNFDRTNYFQNVPTSALDVALWMESDRMGHFAGAISQERLDEQRGVVQNEKRQGENQPYGKFFNFVTKSCFPAGHPYSHTVIGSMEDLNAASLEDVKEWFKDYYGAANAVIVIAGDVNTNEIYEKVKSNFGDIPSGPPVTKQTVNIAKRTGTIREVQQDRVPQTRIYMIWNVPEWGNPEAFQLDFAASALASGKNSRLYKRLVYDEQIASSVNAFNFENEIASIFVVQADVKPGIANETVEKALNEEIDKFLAQGPTEKEMLRAKTQYFANFTRGIERIGGFGGKSDILAQNTIYKGDPEFYKVRLKGMRDAQASEVHKTAQKWLSDGKYVLEINPFPQYATTGADVDRSKLPDVGETASVKFPELQRATLSNGLKVILAERKSVPLINFNLMVDAGYAADQYATPGTAALTMNMIDEGTKDRNSLQINEELGLLGANLGAFSNLDISSVTLSTLKANVDQSLELYSDVILNPAFPEGDFERLKKEQLVGIQREKKQPIQMALRVFPKFMYGKDHAYGMPLTGSGYEETVSKLTRDDLIKFYDTWFKPNNATMVVVGDISMNDLKPKLEGLFKKWKSADVPVKNLAKIDHPEKSKIYLMDRPGSLQSVIIAGHVIDPSGSPDDIAVTTMNNILGGEFTSRINMNLREDKGWAYGAGTFMLGAKGQRPYLVYAPVQTDKSSESMQEAYKEVKEYITTRPPTEEEFRKTQKNDILSLPGQWETLNAVGGSVSNIVRFNLEDDYYQKYADNVKNLILEDIIKASKKTVSPENFSWIVVGDREKIEKKIRALGLGEVEIIDTDGNILKPKGQKLAVEGKGK
ncbi:pitrilysin family protein [Fulvivirgaceae bacterium BMA10]|uniref:Pitrilysin family protein n=1 Tax=Splendidivirga corallicola TaxID=3051826 RepID=A0ABT8KS19_9BACT|nr:pitrilysin family protein [Fulvivirgaceae bacterium BMA10]